MRRIFALVMAFQVFYSPLSQANVKAYYERKSTWTPGHVIVDGKSYDRHFFSGFSDLSEAMKSNPEAAEYADRARIDHIWGSAFIWAGLAGAVGYSLSSNHDWHWGTYWVIFLGGFVPGIILHNYSAMNFNKAMNTYNGISQRLSRITPEKLIMAASANGPVASLYWSY